jgi:DNA-directed RNA polymerase subunit RPC12/RpoP
MSRYYCDCGSFAYPDPKRMMYVCNNCGAEYDERECRMPGNMFRLFIEKEKEPTEEEKLLRYAEKLEARRIEKEREPDYRWTEKEWSKWAKRMGERK